MTEVLVDSSFLYALYATTDKKHLQAIDFSEHTVTRPIIPDVILPEVAFLFSRAGGVPAVARFLGNFVAAKVEPIPVLVADIQRAQVIMTSYASAELDFVDCAIMALA